MTNETRYTRRLQEISIGHTSVVWDMVVTRHGADAYEVNTWGITSCTLTEAAQLIASQEARA